MVRYAKTIEENTILIEQQKGESREALQKQQLYFQTLQSETKALQKANDERATDIDRLNHLVHTKDRELNKLRTTNQQLDHELHQLVNSKIVRLYAPVRALTQMLNKRFNINQWETENCRVEPGYYSALNNDPYLVSSDLTSCNLQGWLYIEASIVFHGDISPAPEFYFDYGEGFSHVDMRTATWFQGRHAAGLIINVDRQIQRIRLDPHNEVCNFKVKNMQVRKISRLTALKLKYREFREVQMKLGRSEQQIIGSAIGSLFDGRLSHLNKHLDNADFEESINKEMPYLKWQQMIEKPATESMGSVKSRLAGLKRRPLFSIIMPTYNTDTELLEKCIDSVLGQSYPNWQLCVADDNSPKASVRKVLKKYSDKHSNIKCAFRTENGHISAASNSALTLADGDFIVLLDHDDELAEHALLSNAELINEHPEAKIVYSDEDKIDEQGNRFDPHFKCDFNRDLLYSQNYVSHLGVYDTALVKSVGGFRLGLEGSQDYDLLLRCVAKLSDKEIFHIPQVLYHWRAIEGSTAMASDQKDYTTLAGIKALQHHFAELGKSTEVTQGFLPNTYNVRWKLKEQPLVSLIIPTYNGYEITKNAIDSILQKTSYDHYEILLINNNSDCAKALAYFKEINTHPKVSVHDYPFPFNYSAINNFAVEKAQGDVVGLINNDVEVISPDWLTVMTEHAMRNDVGCVGAKLYYAEEKIQHAGVVLGIGGVAGHSHKYYERDAYGYFSRLSLTQNYSAVTAAALLVRKEVYNKVNGLNEKDLTVAFNDVDFCLRVRNAGYRNLWTPYAELYHHESISRGAEDSPEKVERFNKEVQYMIDTYGEQLTEDPCYSRNLTLEHEDFSIRSSH